MQNMVNVYLISWSTRRNSTFKVFKVSKEMSECHVSLLLIADDDRNHYCFIKDFGKLVGLQYSSAKNKTYFCRF